MAIVVLALAAPVSVGLAADRILTTARCWRSSELENRHFGAREDYSQTPQGAYSSPQPDLPEPVPGAQLCAGQTVETGTSHGHRLYRSNFELMYCPTRSAAASTSWSPRWA